MNYNRIYHGDTYAYVQGNPKGAFPMNGSRVIAVSKRKVRHLGNDRFSSEVQIRFVDSPHLTERWVPARDIVDFWDNYSDEKEQRIADRDGRIEARKIEQQRIAADTEARFVAAADKWGLERKDLITFSFERGQATVTIEGLERRMDASNRQLEDRPIDGKNVFAERGLV